ncbi:MAG: hypothetical protein Q9169_002149 [Polycauliona sp. 2 TL-2023]
MTYYSIISRRHSQSWYPTYTPPPLRILHTTNLFAPKYLAEPLPIHLLENPSTPTTIPMSHEAIAAMINTLLLSNRFTIILLKDLDDPTYNCCSQDSEEEESEEEVSTEADAPENNQGRDDQGLAPLPRPTIYSPSGGVRPTAGFLLWIRAGTNLRQTGM